MVWRDFYTKFCDFGGEGFYGAWRLAYDEPLFADIIPPEHRQCPVADRVQPRLMQFKTNYGDDASIAKECEALQKTVDWFATRA